MRHLPPLSSHNSRHKVGVDSIALAVAVEEEAVHTLAAAVEEGAARTLVPVDTAVRNLAAAVEEEDIVVRTPVSVIGLVMVHSRISHGPLVTLWASWI